jgi:hypothetical protein
MSQLEMKLARIQIAVFFTEPYSISYVDPDFIEAVKNMNLEPQNAFVLPQNQVPKELPYYNINSQNPSLQISKIRADYIYTFPEESEIKNSSEYREVFNTILDNFIKLFPHTKYSRLSLVVDYDWLVENNVPENVHKLKKIINSNLKTTDDNFKNLNLLIELNQPNNSFADITQLEFKFDAEKVGELDNNKKYLSYLVRKDFSKLNMSIDSSNLEEVKKIFNDFIERTYFDKLNQYTCID